MWLQVTAAFVLLQATVVYWFVEIDEWDYMLRRNSVPAVTPADHLFVHTASHSVGGTVKVSFGAASAMLAVSRASVNAVPYVRDYVFRAERNLSLGGVAGSTFWLMSHPKDRTRARMTLMQRIHSELGGRSGLTCAVVWHRYTDMDEGLADWCVLPAGNLYMIRERTPYLPGSSPTRHPHVYALPNTSQALPTSLPGSVDVEAYAAWFLSSEMARDINHMCVNTVFARSNGVTHMLGTFDADNVLGSRYDRGVSMAADGYFNTLVRFPYCPDWRHVVRVPAVATAIAATWRGARQHGLSDLALTGIVDDFVAKHGAQARQTHAMHTDGRGEQRYSAIYNTFVSDMFTPRNVHSYPGGYTVQVPRTYDGHVADLKAYLLLRAQWLDQHILSLDMAPSKGAVHPAFAVSLVIIVLYLLAMIYVAVRARRPHTAVPAYELLW